MIMHAHNDQCKNVIVCAHGYLCIYVCGSGAAVRSQITESICIMWYSYSHYTAM